MASERAPSSVVDIDPGWYPGQPELLDEQEAAERREWDDQEELEELARRRSDLALSRGEGGASSSSLSADAAASAGATTAGAVGPRQLSPREASEPHAGGGVPTVLTKLRKWGDYASVGAQVLPTKFIPMKTPLSAEILNSWSLPGQPKHRLTVPEMVAQQAALGRKVGLLLDLSNHDCLYTADIPPDVRYLHIQLVAKELPPQDFVDAVVSAALAFWRDNPDEYIAVHCAYGFNRTGFVVCCFLIEVCGLSVEDALAAFATSRPPGVKHEQFRSELHHRYGNGGNMEGRTASYGSVLYGCTAYGSPGENSSFGGCSPSCGSLGDMGLGPSPVSSLMRGPGGALEAAIRAATGARAATNHGGLGLLREGGGADQQQHQQQQQHRTITVTSCSTARKGEEQEDGDSADQPGSTGRWCGRHEPRLGGHGGAPEGGGSAERAPAESLLGTPSSSAAAAERQAERQAERRLASSGDAGPPSRPGEGEADGTDAGPSTPGRRQGSGGGDGGGGGGEDSPQLGTSSQRTTQQSGYAENESLGVNDRFILQTLRQHALVQARAHGSIPEETPSALATPVRGCSSSASLADLGNAAANANTTGCSTPPPGRFSRPSLEAIDWAAAAAAAAAGEEDEAGLRLSGDGAESPAAAVAGLQCSLSGLKL